MPTAFLCPAPPQPCHPTTRRRSRSPLCSAGHPSHPSRPSRRSFLALPLLPLALASSTLRPPPSHAAATPTAADTISDATATLSAARDALREAIPQLVRDARWDACRTELARPPVVNVKEATRSLAAAVESVEGGAGGRWAQGDAGVVRGMREDVLSGLKLLDTFCYNNVFIDESREILGTKVDYDAPIQYLNDALEAMQALLDFVE